MKAKLEAPRHPPVTGTPDLLAAPLPRPDDAGHGWPARVAGLQAERPVGWAAAAAIFAMMAALMAWVVVLLPPGHGIRSNPLFWLLAAPTFPWIIALRDMRRWALQSLWLALPAAPLLALAALFAAPRIQAGRLGAETLGTPLALAVITGVAAALAAAGLLALRRTSLPGGTLPATYLPPGTLPQGRRSLPPLANYALQVGSLTMSGTLVNGILFGIVATVGAAAPGEDLRITLWPIAAAIAPVAAVAALFTRGVMRLNRRTPGALDDLKRAWRLGMACSAGLLALMLAGPGVAAAKGVFGLFMAAMAAAAAWGGLRALKQVPDIAADLAREPGG